MSVAANYTTQNELLLNNLMDFYKNENYLTKMLKIITGESKISLLLSELFAFVVTKAILYNSYQ